METSTFIAVVLFILDWVIKLAFIVYIPRRRNPSSAISWLLLLFIVPFIGILLFLLIGSPKLSKSRRTRQKYIDNLIKSKSPFKDNQLNSLSKELKKKIEPIAELAYSLGKFKAIAGNKVKILPVYNESIKEVVKELKTAKTYINIEYFALALDDTTQPLFEALESAVKRGVRVRVMFDTLGSKPYPHLKVMKQELTRIGVEWHPVLPIKLTRKGYNRPDLRNHRKIVVVDGRVAFIGSQNMVDRSYHRKDDIYYEEVVAKISGPAVNACNAIFASDWYLETGVNISKDINLAKLAPKAGNTIVQLLPSGPNFKHTNNARVFADLIHSAEKELTITTPYFVPNEAILDAITSAALRGVKVNLINSEAMDQWLVGHAQRSYYRQLMEDGVNVYLYNSPVLLHAKHMTIDNDIAVVGSSNMDMRSFELDLECVMIAYDKSVVNDLRKVQAHYIKHAKKLDLKTWEKRNLWQSFRDSVARMTSAIQ